MDDSDGDEGVTFQDRLEFWGLKVAPGKAVEVTCADEDDEQLVHITQARARAARGARWRP